MSKVYFSEPGAAGGLEQYARLEPGADAGGEVFGIRGEDHRPQELVV